MSEEKMKQLETLGEKINNVLKQGLTKEEYKQVMEDSYYHGDICPFEECIYCIMRPIEGEWNK